MRTRFAFACVLVPLALYACDESSEVAATDAGGDAGAPSADGATSDASAAPKDGSSPEADAAPDAPSAPPIRCTQADFDKTAGAGGGDFTGFPGADISFPTTAGPAQYTNHCVKVKVGSSITFSGDFSMHPLEPAGGDVPSPIPATSTNPANNAVTFTVPKAGTFGFQCATHPSAMFGAILVVP